MLATFLWYLVLDHRQRENQDKTVQITEHKKQLRRLQIKTGMEKNFAAT